MENLKVGFEVAINGFDYTHQAWVVEGRYVDCNHPNTMKCGCFGRAHAGEPVMQESEIYCRCVSLQKE